MSYTGLLKIAENENGSSSGKPGAPNSWDWDSAKAGWGAVGALTGGTGLYLLGRLIHGKRNKRAPWIYAAAGALTGGTGAYYTSGGTGVIDNAEKEKRKAEERKKLDAQKQELKAELKPGGVKSEEELRAEARDANLNLGVNAGTAAISVGNAIRKGLSLRRNALNTINANRRFNLNTQAERASLQSRYDAAYANPKALIEASYRANPTGVVKWLPGKRLKAAVIDWKASREAARFATKVDPDFYRDRVMDPFKQQTLPTEGLGLTGTRQAWEYTKSQVPAAMFWLLGQGGRRAVNGWLDQKHSLIDS